MKHRWFSLGVFLLLFGVIVSASAEVYRCVENGKTVFRDEPCGKGKGGKVNLGATIEDDDPTGTRGAVSGSFTIGSASMNISDALGILRKADNEVTLYLIPGRYTSAEVQSFQENGSAEVLGKRPPLNPAVSPVYPYLRIAIHFKPEQPRTRDNIDSVTLQVYGLQGGEEPVSFDIEAEARSTVLRQLSIFEDITQGDIDMEAEQETRVGDQPVSWRISIRAPLFFR